MGFFPSLSRASTSLRLRESQMASANMPCTRSANSSSHSRYARSTTSVSLRVVNGCPLPRSSSRSAAKSYASPLNAMATPSRTMGWSPDSRSRMASRRWPSPAGPSKKNPSASRPRCAMARAARRTPSASGAPARSTSPQMPHTSVPHGPRQRFLRPVQLFGDQIGAFVLRLVVSADYQLGEQAHQQAEGADQREHDGDERQGSLDEILEAGELVVERPDERRGRAGEGEEAESAEHV